MNTKDDSNGFGIVVDFPVRPGTQTPQAKAPHEHRLFRLVADLTVAEKVDFVLHRLYREPPDNPDLAAKMAEANMAMFGHFLLIDILLEAAAHFPELGERYAHTIALVEPVRDYVVSTLINRSTLPPSGDQ